MLRAFQGWNLALGVVCLALFVAALVSGQGVRSLAFLFAAVWWAALGIYWGRRSRNAQRHALLRARRLRRERAGSERVPYGT